MKKFRVDVMNGNSYSNMMQGLPYSSKTIIVEAETKEEAIAKAQKLHPCMCINHYTVEGVEEYEAKEKAWRDHLKKVEQAEAEAKARKAQREREKAEAMGLTVEEYKRQKRREAKIRATIRKIAEMEKEVEEMKKYLEKLQQA